MTGKKVLRYILQLLDNTPIELQNAPDGWKDSRIKFARSAKYSGLIKSFSFPFNFVLRGATELRNAFYQYGLKSSVRLFIDRLNYNTNEYNRIFNGKIDFSKAEDSKTSFKVNAVNDDISSKIAAYEGVKYAIPVDVDEAINITLTPITLKEQATLSLVNRNNPQADTFPGWQIVTNQQNSVTPSVQAVDSFYQTNPDYTTVDKWFYRATKNTPVRVKIDITDIALLPTTASSSYAIELRNSSGALVRTLYSYSKGNTGIVPAIPFEVHVDFIYNATTGERLFIYFDSSRDGQQNDGFLINAARGSIELSYDTISPASICKGLPIKYVFDQLIAKINGGAYSTSSTLLTTVFANVYLTCSNAIRKINAGTIFQAGDNLQIGGKYIVLGGSIIYNGATYTVNNTFDYISGVNSFTTNQNGFVQIISVSPALYISFKDFFQAVKSWMGGQAGFGIENEVAKIEDLRVFYRPQVTAMDVGSINDWQLTPATDLIPNSIKVGYDDQQYDSINGTQEVNSEQRFTTPIDTLDSEETANELDLISPIRADAYGIEQTRIQPVDSAASRSDNDTFAIWVGNADVSGNYAPLDLSGVTYSGIDADYYNWRLSPKQNLYRGRFYLASLFYGMNAYSIRFESGEKNTSMVVIDAGIRFAEGENLPIQNLLSNNEKPIFLPYYTSVNVAVPINAIDLLGQSGYGVIKYEYLGRQLFGYIDELTVISILVCNFIT